MSHPASSLESLADSDSRLAELMLPDGAHLRPEDWTVFYLGQTASSAVAPMLSHESSVRISTVSDRQTSMLQASGELKRGVAGGGLLYVLNCVRMKEDKKMRRGAMVKALAICTPNPYIGVYKVRPQNPAQADMEPLLLLALEEYFLSPSPEILARLYDSANAIPTAGMPRLSRSERILLRCQERKDVFEEKFVQDSGTREVFDDTGSEERSVEEGSVSSHQRGVDSSVSSTRRPGMPRKGSSSNSQLHLATPPSKDGRLTPDAGHGETAKRRKGLPRDTHFYETEARFKKITVPIRIPLTVFDEDVGDVSRILTRGGLIAVLHHRAGTDILTPQPLPGTVPPIPTYEWVCDPSGHPHPQCHARTQTSHVSRPWSPRQPSGAHGPRCLRGGIRLRPGHARDHRDRLPICQPGQSRYPGRVQWLRSGCDESALRGAADDMGRAL